MITPQPAPRTIGIIQHPYLLDSFVVVKVVRLLKSMWEISYLNACGEWEGAVRRKITAFRTIKGDPMVARANLLKADKQHAADTKAAAERYRKSIVAIAEGTYTV